MTAKFSRVLRGLRATGSVCAALTLAALGSGCAAAEAGGMGVPSGWAGDQPVASPGAESPCRQVGVPRLVATRAFAPAGVRASLEDGRVAIRFAHHKAQCMQVALADIASADFGGEEPAECPEGDAPVVATSEGETMMAREATWDAAKHPRIELGVVVYDAPSVLGFHSQKPQLIERMFEPAQGKRVGGETSPGVAALAHKRFLLTWVDENPDGHRLHAQVVEKWGAAVGGQMDLSPADASVIGRASAVAGADGRGLVAYLASNGHGFEVLETTVVCGAHGDARR